MERITAPQIRALTGLLNLAQEAVELVFDALKYGVGGEVFVPQLPAFRINRPDRDPQREASCEKNEVSVIGVRPGEKIHELMINSSEIPRTYRFNNRFVIISQIEEYLGAQKAEIPKRE